MTLFSRRTSFRTAFPSVSTLYASTLEKCKHRYEAWSRSSSTSTLTRFAKVALGTTTLSLVLSVSNFTFAVHNSESAPHRCAGCVNGTCQPRSSSYGHYQAHWRRWPSATEYKGFRKEKPKTAVPEPLIPEASDEIRVNERTRSDRPLDPEPGMGGSIEFGGNVTGGMADPVIPDASSETDLNNPFNQVVPETDIPANGAGGPAGGGLGDGGAGGFDAGGAGGLEPGGGDNSLQDSLFENNPPPTTTPDTDFFGPTGGGADPAEDLFGPTSGLVPPSNYTLVNVSAVRSIKNRRLDFQGSGNEYAGRTSQPQTSPTQTRQPKNRLTTNLQNPIPAVIGQVPDVPQIDSVGGSFGNDSEFTPNDLRSPTMKAPKAKSEIQDAFEQVSFEEPVAPEVLPKSPSLSKAGDSQPPAMPKALAADSVQDSGKLKSVVEDVAAKPEMEQEAAENQVKVPSEEVVTEEVILPNGNPLRAKRRIVKTVVPKTVAPKTVASKTTGAKTVAPKTVAPKTAGTTSVAPTSHLQSSEAKPVNGTLSGKVHGKVQHGSQDTPQRVQKTAKSLVPKEGIQLRPIPKTSSLGTPPPPPAGEAKTNVTSSSKPTQAGIELKPLASSTSTSLSNLTPRPKTLKAVAKTHNNKKLLETTRSLTSLNSRSLRDTLRKNPLR